MHAPLESCTNLDRAIERYRGTISTFARNARSALPQMDQEDIEQELYIILWKCVEGYDPEKGASFNTLFQGSAKNKVISLIRHYRTGMRQPKHGLIHMDNEDVAAAVAALLPSEASAEDWYIAVAEHGTRFLEEQEKADRRYA